MLELLISLALGSVLVVAAIKLHGSLWQDYQSAKDVLEDVSLSIQSQNILPAITGQTAFPCGKTVVIRNLLNNPPAWLQPFTHPITFLPPDSQLDGIKPRGQTRGARSYESKILVLSLASLPAVPLTQHDIPGYRFMTQGITIFNDGDIAIVCDERATVLLQIVKDGYYLRYTSTSQPGNCNQPFISQSCGHGIAFDKGAVALRFTPTIFYIGNNYAANGLSLYVQRGTPRTFRGTKIFTLQASETISGIENIDGDTLYIATSSATEFAILATMRFQQSPTASPYYKGSFFSLNQPLY